MTLVGALDVGGTHVTGALVERILLQVDGEVVRATGVAYRTEDGASTEVRQAVHQLLDKKREKETKNETQPRSKAVGNTRKTEDSKASGQLTQHEQILEHVKELKATRGYKELR